MIKLQQEKPSHAKLIKGDKKSHQLVYLDIVTGEEVAVPNIWYNNPDYKDPIPQSVKYMKELTNEFESKT
jgi:hypothetical protein